MRKRQEPPSHILQNTERLLQPKQAGKCYQNSPSFQSLSLSFFHRSIIGKGMPEARLPVLRQPSPPFGLHAQPRGGPDDLPEELMRRFSLCCSNRGCRRRVLPPSVLFMGRRGYRANVILVLVTVCQNKPQEYSKAALMSKFGMCRATLNNWITWFREFFPHTDEWRSIRGLVHSSVSDSCLPFSLNESFPCLLQRNPGSFQGLSAPGD